VFPDFEVSEPNTMQAVIGAVVAVSSFGAAYAAHMVFPVKPIDEADLLLSQSTIGTVNILNKEELERKKRTPRQLIQLYLDRKANLEDVIEIVTGKSSIKEAYSHLQSMEQTAEIKFLIKATEKNYNVVDKAESQESVHVAPPAPSGPPAAPEPSTPPSTVGIGTPITPSPAQPAGLSDNDMQDRQRH
jgi:hypothetical protein